MSNTLGIFAVRFFVVSCFVLFTVGTSAAADKYRGTVSGTVWSTNRAI